MKKNSKSKCKKRRL